MKLDIIILSKVNQNGKDRKERKRQIPYDITYIWNLIYSPNEPFHRKENHGHALVDTKRAGEGMGWIGSLGLIDANYCLWNGWICSEILLYSTGNYM